MAGSSFGKIFTVTTFGESHGSAVGVVVDGVPSLLPLTEADIQPFMDRRRPGANRFTTARKESDKVRILSGTFEGKTTGTPLTMVVFNEDQHSSDYLELKDVYRPGHADLTYDLKYGIRDYRGGGRSSGRETIGRVAGGAVASIILQKLGVRVLSWVSSIGPAVCDPKRFDLSFLKNSALAMPDPAAEKEAAAYLEECKASLTSAGGTVTCIVSGMKSGIGEPVFDKLDACLGKALFSIGAVKAVEIGSGTSAAAMRGNEHNDQAGINENGLPVRLTNHAGGILGGISSGDDILLKVTFKPTPSISAQQSALHTDGTVSPLTIGGRHDPQIPSRAAVVVEAMTAMTILDLMMINMSSTMDGLIKFYS